MRTVRLLFVVVALVVLTGCACRKAGKGGAGAADAMGDGNIPVATPGVELQDSHFSFDSSTLDAGARAVLNENAKWLLDNPDKDVVVEGHCDERGTAEYNMALGQRRAKSALDYLRSLGVSADRMSTISYGEELPLDPRSNEEAWAKNRRVHLAVK